MKVLMSSRPRRGSCSEYCNSMSGAANSSTMPRLQVLPQKCVNHRPTMALLSSSLDMSCLSVCSHLSEGSTELPAWTLDKRHRGRHPLSVWNGRNDVTREVVVVALRLPPDDRQRVRSSRQLHRCRDHEAGAGRQ